MNSEIKNEVVILEIEELEAKLAPQSDVAFLD
jgi:hypothetical protein